MQKGILFIELEPLEGTIQNFLNNTAFGVRVLIPKLLLQIGPMWLQFQIMKKTKTGNFKPAMQKKEKRKRLLAILMDHCEIDKPLQK